MASMGVQVSGGLQEMTGSASMAGKRGGIYRSNLILLYVLLGSLVLDIGGGLGLKYIVFVPIILFSLLTLFQWGMRRSWGLEFGLAAYFIATGVYAYFRGIELQNILSELSFLAFFAVLPLMAPLGSEKLYKAFVSVTVFAALIVIGTFILLLIYPGLGDDLHQYANRYRWGYLGLKPGLSVPNVYFRWSLWVLIGFALVLGRGTFKAATFALAAIATLSTALIGGAILIYALLALIDARPGLRARYCFTGLGLIVIFLLGFFVFPEIFGFVTSKFDLNSESTSLKIGHIESIVNLLKNDQIFLFFGMGPGSEFYSTGVGKYVANVEVSHFNIVRQYGLIGAFFVFSYIFYVIYLIWNSNKIGKRLAVALGVGFVVAGTNPFLLSPIFFVPLFIARSYAASFKGRERDECFA